jgi:rod shape determining protein RodA
VMMLFDYRHLEEWAYVIYGVSLLALLGVRAVGRVSSLGATREINLGPLTIQPSEFAVFAVIVTVAVFLHRHDAELGPRNLFRLAVVVVPLILLILLEPDLGTTIICVATFVAMLVVGGVRLRYFLVMMFLALLALIAAVKLHLLHSYQSDRFTAWLHQSRCAQPEYARLQECYQLQTAKAAIGAGGAKGTGLFRGALTRTGFIPEEYADFIFSAIGEQLGFLGSLLVIGLFGVMSLRMIRAIQIARDTLGRVICAGALAFIAFSAFQNIAMNVGLMPITGIPLPFLSYGGSALFTSFAAVGLVANVEMRRWRGR